MPDSLRDLDLYNLGNDNKTLDPPPMQKWAEEGYTVVEIVVESDKFGIEWVEGLLWQAFQELGKLPNFDKPNAKYVAVGAYFLTPFQ